MKYVELKNSLKSGHKNAYLITGDDRFLCYDALSKIEDSISIQIKDMNSVSISGDGVSAKEIVEAANIYPFGDEFRLVVVKDFNPKKNEEEFNRIQNYLSAPLNSTILVFFNLSGSEFFNGMKGLEVVDCSKLDAAHIKMYIKNNLAKNEIMASEDAIDKLIMFSSFDMTKIVSELEKLSAYVADSKQLTSEIVEEFVVQDNDFKVFELAEFLAKGDAVNAFKLIDSFMFKPGSAFMILSPLYNNYRRVLFAAINREKTNQELAELLGIKEYAIKMLGNQVKAFSPKTLKIIVDMLGDLDYKIKAGEIKENIAIKLAATNILNLRGKNE
ncbi:MAG: DNA polymerase III subunit delta [Clostridia bacterium]|nr:DNA polymerase III subunit delta [Clostridia bacterium]